MIIFADKQTHNQSSKQILNLITEAHSYPLWIVGERANISLLHSVIPYMYTRIWLNYIVCYCIYIALLYIVCYYIYIQLIYMQWSEVYHQCILHCIFHYLYFIPFEYCTVWFLYKYIDCTLGMQLSLCCNNNIMYYLHLNLSIYSTL